MKTFEVVVRLYYSANRPDRNYEVARFSLILNAQTHDDAVEMAEERFVFGNGVIDFEIEQVNTTVER